jgi:hypothetical protein
VKLNKDDLRKLREACDGQDLAHMLDDACEVLTLKVVLLVKKRRDALLAELPKHQPGTVGRAGVAAQVNLLGRLLVELAEAE